MMNEGSMSKSRSRAIGMAVAASLTLGACAEGENEGLSTLIGAGLGAFIGHEIGGHGDGAVIGTVIGTAVGASIGNEVGRKMDERDYLVMARARHEALDSSPSGVASDWTNPDTGNYGTFVPEPAYKESGEYCREYTQTITVGGETEKGYGTACRRPDGSWQIISG